MKELIQNINGVDYKLYNDYQVDNHAYDNWAMYAFAIDLQTQEEVQLVVRVDDELRAHIDNGNAELDMIDYSCPIIKH